MRRKNALEYIMLGLFIMCMALALSAALEKNTVATEREYLLQGAYLLTLTAVILVTFLAVRLLHRLRDRVPVRLRNAVCLTISAVMFILGLYLRLRTIHGIVLEPESDFETYYRMAGHLLNSTMLTPEAEVDRQYIALYPHTVGFPMLVLLPVFRIFGMSVHNALYANVVCSMVSVVLVGHIANRTMGKGASVLAVTLMSLWPSHILYCTMVATEPSYTMMMLIALDLMISATDRRPNSLYATTPLGMLLVLPAIGVTVALAGAIRPTALLLLAAWAVVQMMTGGDPLGKINLEGIRVAVSKGWLCVLVAGLFYWGTSTIITSAVKDIIMEQPASGLTASGYNMMVGLNVKYKGSYNAEDSAFLDEAYKASGSATEAHSAAMQCAIQRITSEPENVLNLMVYKFRDLWNTDDFSIDWNLLWAGQQQKLTDELSRSLEKVRACTRPVYMAVLLLAMLGAVETFRRQHAPIPLQMIGVLHFLATAFSHMLLETQVRYHYSIIPILILLAVLCVHQWRERTAEESPVRVVYQRVASMEAQHEDHTHFDMAAALANGHVKMTVSAAYQQPIRADAAAPAVTAAPVPEAEPAVRSEEASAPTAEG